MLASLLLLLSTAAAAAPASTVVASPGLLSVNAPAGSVAAYLGVLETELGRAGLVIVPATTLRTTAAETCNDWRGGEGATGVVGRPEFVGPQHLQAGGTAPASVSCALPQRLYCLQDPVE